MALCGLIITTFGSKMATVQAVVVVGQAVCSSHLQTVLSTDLYHKSTTLTNLHADTSS